MMFSYVPGIVIGVFAGLLATVIANRLNISTAFIVAADERQSMIYAVPHGLRNALGISLMLWAIVLWKVL